MLCKKFVFESHIAVNHKWKKSDCDRDDFFLFSIQSKPIVMDSVEAVKKCHMFTGIQCCRNLAIIGTLSHWITENRRFSNFSCRIFSNARPFCLRQTINRIFYLEKSTNNKKGTETNCPQSWLQHSSHNTISINFKLDALSHFETFNGAWQKHTLYWRKQIPMNLHLNHCSYVHMKSLSLNWTWAKKQQQSIEKSMQSCPEYSEKIIITIADCSSRFNANCIPHVSHGTIARLHRTFARFSTSSILYLRWPLMNLWQLCICKIHLFAAASANALCSIDTSKIERINDFH